ncbi:hypothetical protein DZC72_04210 [Maribacter algicola]|uniref:Uncharacterized protein n=1 Tax=Maribacter algicola TaxID=2498892 RepID=A0A3R8WGV8_9FLAO|nr:hypothetical protein [Maribacter algicola]RRQ49801.1 hypothetical protein DZC72_04210 [Maribacter algicola]
MSSIVTAYQTLEDRDNIDEIEFEGPFKCTRNNAWLGHGYYFWDTNIDWAMAWGKSCYLNKGKKFVIGRCQVNLSKDCFDLLGCVAHWQEFLEVINVFITSGKIKDSSQQTVPNIIMFMKRKGIFPYKSIRAADFHKNSIQLYFKEDQKEYMVVNQRVQICVIDIKEVLLHPFSVIYPD